MTSTELQFKCSICGDPSTDICAWCTKDACANHLCAKCLHCSDCCHCEVPLEEHTEAAANHSRNSSESVSGGQPSL